MINDQKGFSLLELVVVLGIMGIMMTIAITTIGSRGPSMRLKSDARDLVSNMQLARVRAIRDTRTWAVLFDIPKQAYILYSDAGETPPTWSDGNEDVFRRVSLGNGVRFGSQQGVPATYVDPVDGVSYAGELVVFNSNGTMSETGEVYLTIGSGESFGVFSLSTTGNLKIQKNYGSGWE